MTEKAFVNIFARLLRWSGFAVATVAAVLMVLAPGGSASADFSVVDFRQCANEDNTLGDCHWISSIVQQSNSKYYEGMSVPQRVVFTGITTTSGNVHTLTFTHQATKAGKHAYDWLTSYGQAIAAAAAAGVPYADLNGQACDDEIGPPGTLGATCASLRSGSNFTVDVPDDPFVSKDGSTQSRINAYEGTYGNRTIKIYGNSAFSGASLSLSHSVGNGGDTSDSDINYTLTWTSASTAVLIELAGHLAVSGPAAVAWGAGLGSSQISGGPYHFNLSSLDGTSTGSQDNQIKGADILVATPTVVTDIHNASEQVVTSVSAGTTVHDKATVSGNAGTPTGSVTFTFYTTASNCTGASVASGTVALDGSGVAHPSTSQGPLNAGSYSFRAHYTPSQGSNYTEADSPCEPLAVGKLTPTVATQIHLGADHAADVQGQIIPAGSTVHDRATVADGFGTPLGTVTFNWYTNGTCASTPADTSSALALTSGAVDATGFAKGPLSAGSYSFKAHYNGDTNYAAADGPCEAVTVQAAALTLTPPTATNERGTQHTVTATLTVNGSTPAGVLINFSVSGANAGASGTCNPVSCQTNSSGQVTFTYTGTNIGTDTISATAPNVPIGQTTVQVSATPVSKLWVDANIQISPLTANNEIGTPHVLTGHVSVSSGGGYVNAPNGTTINFAVVTGPGSLSAPSCVTAGGTGDCSVTLTSATAGVTTVSASTTVTVGGVVLTRTTNSTGSNSAPAAKNWVDANIQISPLTGVNPIGAPHLLTGHVNVNPGTGYVNAPASTTISFTIVSGPGSLSAPSCLTVGTTGSCSVTLTSATPGVTTVSASTTVTVGGVVLTRTTNGTAGNSGNATKDWQAGKLEVVKDLIPASDQGRFTLYIKQGEGTIDSEPNVGDNGTTGENTLPPGVYQVGETAFNGTSLSNYAIGIECRAGNGEGSVVASGSGAGPLNVTVNNNDDIVCVVTNTRLGSITIRKNAEPTSGQDFTFSATNLPLAGFTLDDDGVSSNPLSNLQQFPDLLPGDRVITETSIPGGWKLTNIACSGGSGDLIGSDSDFDAGDTSVSISLAAGENVDCTFTNTQGASITIDKVTEPSGNTTIFDFTRTGTGFSTDFALTDAAAPNTTANLSVGTYTVTEGLESGWTLTGLTCSNEESTNIETRTATITLSAGENVTCTFTNTAQPGSILAHKFNDLDGDGVQDEGEPNLSGWQMTVVGTACQGPTNAGGDFLCGGLTIGSYTVQETLQAGWINTTPVSVQATVVSNQTTTVNFGNRQLGSVAWEKRNESASGHPLQSGATFTVGGTVGPFACTGNTANPVTVVDGGANDGDADGGQLLLPNVCQGTYVVTETGAPGGFNIDDDPTRAVTVSASELSPVVGVQGQDNDGNTDESDFHNTAVPEEPPPPPPPPPPGPTPTPTPITEVLAAPPVTLPKTGGLPVGLVTAEMLGLALLGLGWALRRR